MNIGRWRLLQEVQDSGEIFLGLNVYSCISYFFFIFFHYQVSDRIKDEEGERRADDIRAHARDARVTKKKQTRAKSRGVVVCTCAS